MTPTKRFRRQHRELQAIAAELLRVAMRPSSDVLEIQRLLGRFMGKLRVHAAMETECLYPALLASEDDDVRGRAERLHEELGPLYGMMFAFVERWETASAIDARRVRFRIELSRVMAKLGWRMMREDRELYPMADEVIEERYSSAPPPPDPVASRLEPLAPPEPDPA